MANDLATLAPVPLLEEVRTAEGIPAAVSLASPHTAGALGRTEDHLGPSPVYYPFSEDGTGQIQG